MIEKIKKIPVTEESHPFGTAARKCEFARNGYVEEEYFLYGTSKVYKWRGGKKTVAFEGAPYVNRLIVRKPENTARFSKNVVVEILNSTSFIDFDRVWVLCRRHMMRKGDVYIGVTSKPNVLSAMYKMDYERYSELCWPNPCGEDTGLSPEKLGNMEGASSPCSEDGLFWDMLTDLAKMLRVPHNELLPEYGHYWQYLSGWSQSGGYMIRFLNTFAYERNQKQPYFDGYFSCGSASVCMPDLNQSYGATGRNLPRMIQKCREPFIEVHTESENQKWGNYEARGEDSDSRELKYRVYDIAGATHDSKSTMIDYYMGDCDVMKCGIIPNYPGKEIYPNDSPYELVFHAALEYLYRWTREGIPPVRTAPIETDENHENITDEHGNAKGGWRLPFITCPLAAYVPYCTPMKPEFTFASRLFGYKEPFPDEKVRTLYKTYDNYMQKVENETDRCIREGLLLAEDRESCIAYCEALAGRYGHIW
ncbi:alpha/beta hydrolase domain-containing protein [Extibacter muris]|uniref:alpha/beta hydrolase domain-containing protein n=1 Tax=Extibacter muris TaxID=1796622 RepID=UPI001D065295|nr:alpha/beta hydrolase domain-containing protein [Extibacter muris]MCB6203240.1 hypothetical protein [Extibacter muris]MCQ4664836.1 alpha/beta hydrolase domain-containing protein [Extibacter muris]MCQ4694845.1 alpha/beta hydrolase domain-containing protein [Extibacter muris]